MKSMLWMTLGALLWATGCDEGKKGTGEVAKDGAPEVKDAAKQAAAMVGEAVTAPPKALKAPIADGVEPGFAYSEVVEMTIPATGGGEQRTVKLWVKELTPSEAADKLAGALAEAGFEKAEPGMHMYKFKKSNQEINLNTLDFKPGDENGNGIVDVTIITK